MQEAIRFALLGLGLGALYSLTAQGLVIVYRGSGVLNFAQGAIGVAAGYVAWDVQYRGGAPYLVAFAAGIAVSATIGALSHLLVMRPLRRAAPLTRVVATLGLLIVLQALIVLRYSTNVTNVPSALPTDLVDLGGQIVVGTDRLILLGLATASTLALWALYRWSSFGLGTSAVASNQRAAAALGWSPDRIATINWALGSALAGAATILVSPVVQLQVTTMTTLTLAAMAAALVGSFNSFPVTFAAAMALGVAQTMLQRYVHTPGFASSVPFLLVAVILVVGGRSLPLRDFFLQRLPAVGSGRVSPPLAGSGLLIAVVLIAVLPESYALAFSITFGFAFILLAIVVLTGYAGQLSLAMYAVAGFGAYVAGRLDSTLGWAFVPSAAAGIIAAALVSVLLALPALRTRGINLAIVTLGLGTAMELMIFSNGDITGGIFGTPVPPPRILGVTFDPVLNPMRYALLSLGLFTLAALAVASVRRGRSGRRLLAVRTNERAAAALGIAVGEAKLYAFALAGALAAVGGILIAFQASTIVYTQFTSFISIAAVAWAVIGGVGYVMGAVSGAAFAPGAIGAQLGSSVFSGIEEYVPLIGGAVLLLLILQNQNGLVHENVHQWGLLRARLARRGGRREPTPRVQLPPEERTPVPGRTLEVRGLGVRYGGVVAVDDLSLTVSPGQIVGLIGPNGAGKTTAIDAITGFVRPNAGSVLLDGLDLSGTRVAQRSRLGIARSFQSLELFEDLPVLDNLRVAADPRDRLSYVRDLVHPAAPPLPGEVVAAIREFRLEADLDRLVEDLPYGQRRLLAIARAVATQPSVLLLDEPAAGLGSAESAELATLVRRLADEWNLAILLVEHDMDFVMSICDEITVLDFGRTIARGCPEQIQASPAVVAAYLGEDELEGARR